MIEKFKFFGKLVTTDMVHFYILVIPLVAVGLTDSSVINIVHVCVHAMPYTCPNSEELTNIIYRYLKLFVKLC